MNLHVVSEGDSNAIALGEWLTNLPHLMPLEQPDLDPGCCCSSCPQGCHLGIVLARQEPAVVSLAFGTYLPRLANFVRNLVAGFVWLVAACQAIASVTFEAEDRGFAELGMAALQCWCFQGRAGPAGSSPRDFEIYEATRESRDIDPEVLRV